MYRWLTIALFLVTALVGLGADAFTGLPIFIPPSYPFTVTDLQCGYRIQTNGGALILPPASGFSTGPCDIEATNASRTNSTILTGFPSPIFGHLWPGTTLEVTDDGVSNWDVAKWPGRWWRQGVNLYFGQGGNDATGDGLTPATAWATGSYARGVLGQEIDAAGSPPTINMLPGRVVDNIVGSGQIVGYNYWILAGATYSYVDGGVAPGASILVNGCQGSNLMIGDNDEAKVFDIAFSNANGCPGVNAISMHNYSVGDIDYGNSFIEGPFNAHFSCDMYGTFGIASYMVDSDAAHEVEEGLNCTFEQLPGTITIVGTSSIDTMYYGSGDFQIDPDVSYSGALGAGLRQWQVSLPGTITTGGNTIPGTPGIGGYSGFNYGPGARSFSVSGMGGSTMGSAFVVAGFGGTITPIGSGNVDFKVTSTYKNTTPNNGCRLEFVLGIGAPPATGTLVSATNGTVVGTVFGYYAAIYQSPLMEIAYASNLAQQQSYWYDLAYAADSPGTTCVMGPATLLAEEQ